MLDLLNMRTRPCLASCAADPEKLIEHTTRTAQYQPRSTKTRHPRAHSRTLALGRKISSILLQIELVYHLSPPQKLQVLYVGRPETVAHHISENRYRGSYLQIFPS